MLKMQDSLNNDMAGDKWKTRKTKEGRTTEYELNAIGELIEHIESYPYKHWHDINRDPDIENAQLELVDVFHFLLSMSMQRTERLSIAEIPGIMARTYSSAKEEVALLGDGVLTLELRSNLVRTLINKISGSSPMSTIFFSFFCLTEATDMNLDKLYRLYMIKNVLNQFRQSKGDREGDREGDYSRIWHGEEDNSYITSYLIENPDVDKESILEYLEVTYKSLGL